MKENFLIEQISYELIKKARNIRDKERQKLFGHIDRFIAVRKQGNGYYVLMHTMGSRDECARLLHHYMDESSLVA